MKIFHKQFFLYEHLSVNGERISAGFIKLLGSGQVRSGDQDYSCSMLLYHEVSTTCFHASGLGSTALSGHSSRSMLVFTQNKLGRVSSSSWLTVLLGVLFCFLFLLWFNVPVNNFSVMLRRSHLFLGITSTFGE